MRRNPELTQFPGMTSWFDPGLLARLLLRVIVSETFERYADRRLLIAALDQASPDTHLARADLSQVVTPGADGARWIDYVSDLGDGFDATYAVAYHLAQPSLTVDGPALPGGSATLPGGSAALPRGRLLVMGGDQVYPSSGMEEYRTRLIAPYELAFPDGSPGPNPLLYLVPGNHDWYDGLVSFMARFCRAKPTEVGHWRTPQRRSYFALHLGDDWWVWGIDIALSENMDQPQADYFVGIAQAMRPGAKIILCTAKPGWYEDEKEGAFRSLHYAARIIANATEGEGPPGSRNLRIVLVLSGDTHHYARYASSFSTQFITSGGGGAFLHGTQALRDEIPVAWLRPDADRLALEACHPPKAESRRLLRGNLGFAFRNPGFSALLGAVYALLGAWAFARMRLDTALLSWLVLAAGFTAYGRRQEPVRKGRATLFALAQASLHAGAILATAALCLTIAGYPPGGAGAGWGRFFGVLPPGFLVGWLIGGTLFGAGLWLGARHLDLNHEDAFSALRLDGYRHFLRLRLAGDTVTVYPIGLDRVPARGDWRPNTPTPDHPSRYAPPDAGCPMRLVEPPVTVRAATVTAADAAVDKASLTADVPGTRPPTDAP
ncbi:hypothetical protein [Methylobacterium nonmethylotrophicum]|uniref:Calcineurin-like phosphoesterase domain-containing protein n=1 Tax=Methylobacterium nonmethylotrophicum TaxID=1141884 RepID=A0A4Z0NNE1_9HYPH|nr:hypothetical protein [Methylobacterium nonmethylotrophicum]TGD98215.1 hypothetical protein EU555_15975 [Methylobacterium nonmethylotrophicum]